MTTEIHIYGEIGIDVTAQLVAAELEAAAGDDVHIRFNTPGGVGSDGIAIHNRLKEYSGHVRGTIDGVCASAGMIAAMGCDELEMASNAFVMIHDSWVDMSGNAKDLDQRSRMLKKFDEHQANIFSERSGMPLDQIETLMDREDELDAQEALSLGLIDAITGESRIAANLNKETIMARAKLSGGVRKTVKKATKKRPVKKQAAKKARTRSVAVELEEEYLTEDDDLLSEEAEYAEDEEMAEDDDLLSEEEEYAEDEEMAMDPDEAEEMAEDDEYAEDDEEPTVKAASYRQIVKACSGINPKASADAKFIARVQSRGLSVAGVRSAWMRELRARLDRNSGVDPVSSRRGSQTAAASRGGSAVARFNALVRERMKITRCSRVEAVKIVAKANKELHKAFLLETNPGRRHCELIQDRFRN